MNRAVVNLIRMLTRSVNHLQHRIIDALNKYCVKLFRACLSDSADNFPWPPRSQKTIKNKGIIYERPEGLA